MSKFNWLRYRKEFLRIRHTILGEIQDMERDAAEARAAASRYENIRPVPVDWWSTDAAAAARYAAAVASRAAEREAADKLRMIRRDAPAICAEKLEAVRQKIAAELVGSADPRPDDVDGAGLALLPVLSIDELRRTAERYQQQGNAAMTRLCASEARHRLDTVPLSPVEAETLRAVLALDAETMAAGNEYLSMWDSLSAILLRVVKNPVPQLVSLLDEAACEAWADPEVA